MSDPVDLNELEAAARAIKHGAVWRGFDGPDGITKDEALEYAGVLADAFPGLVARLRQAEEDLRAGSVEMKALVGEVRAAGAEVVSLREALAEVTESRDYWRTARSEELSHDLAALREALAERDEYASRQADARINAEAALATAEAVCEAADEFLSAGGLRSTKSLFAVTNAYRASKASGIPRPLLDVGPVPAGTPGDLPAGFGEQAAVLPHRHGVALHAEGAHIDGSGAES